MGVILTTYDTWEPILQVCTPTNLVEAAPSAFLSPTSSGFMEVAGGVMVGEGVGWCGVKRMGETETQIQYPPGN